MAAAASNRICAFCSDSSLTFMVCGMCEIGYCMKSHCRKLHERLHGPREKGAYRCLQMSYPATVDMVVASRVMDLSVDEGELVIMCSTADLMKGCVASVSASSVSKRSVDRVRKCVVNLTMPIRDVVKRPPVIDSHLEFYTSMYFVDAMKEVQERVGIDITYMEIVATYMDAVTMIVDPSILGQRGFKLAQQVEGAGFSSEMMMFGHYALMKHKNGPMPSIPVCAGCHRSTPGMKRCGRCRMARYCDAECMKRHAKDHRPVCKRRAEPVCFCMQPATVCCSVCGVKAYCPGCEQSDDAKHEHMTADCVCVFCRTKGAQECCSACGHGFCEEMSCQVLHSVRHEQEFCVTAIGSTVLVGFTGFVDTSVAGKHFNPLVGVVAREPGFAIELLRDVSCEEEGLVQVCVADFLFWFPPDTCTQPHHVFFSVPVRPLIKGKKPSQEFGTFLKGEMFNCMKFIQDNLDASTSYYTILATYPDVVKEIITERLFQGKGITIRKVAGSSHALEVAKFVAAMMVQHDRKDPPCALTVACPMCHEMVFCETCKDDPKETRKHVSRCLCKYCRAQGLNVYHCSDCGIAHCNGLTCAVTHKILHDVTHADTGEGDTLRVVFQASIDMARVDRSRAMVPLYTAPGFVVELDVASISKDPVEGTHHLCEVYVIVPLRKEKLVDDPDLLGIADPMRTIQSNLGASTSYQSIMAAYPDIVDAILHSPREFILRGFDLTHAPPGEPPENVMRFVGMVMERFSRVGLQQAFAGMSLRACLVCGQPARSKCGRCKGARYCSRKCQQEGWGSHRLDCIE